MPQLGNEEINQQIILPSTLDLPEDQRAWVVMDVSPNKAGDYYNINNMVVGHITFAVLLERIKDWNYQDAEGEKLPITLDTLKRLNAQDFQFLQEQIASGSDNKLDDTQKKTSLDSSSQAVNVPVEIE
jgi:hypothetical protein